MLRLLLIEDDPEIRELIQSVLEVEYNVLAASSLDEAEDCWLDHGEEINLVLSDLCLPDAKSTVSRVRGWQTEYPGLQAVFVSGLGVAAVQADFGLEEGVDFLSKPFTFSELRKTVAGAASRCETLRDKAA